MSRAWTFRDPKLLKKHGSQTKWSVGWYDPEGHRRCRTVGSKSMAEKVRRQLEGELAAGIFQTENRKKWTGFRREYEERIASGLSSGTRAVIDDALNHFERICKPVKVQSITTRTIDEFKAKRKMDRGRKRGSKLSVATVNRDLRHVKAALRIANEWGYLPKVPKVRMLREPSKLAIYVTPDHFAAIYKACDVAVRPKGTHYPPVDWWRAFITFQYMTGWRVCEPLALTWDDVSLDSGQAITRHADNKGKRDERAPLHPAVVEHLRKIVDFGVLVFPWPHNPRELWSDYARVQEAAGIHLPCREKHEHTTACHLYGFHDLRRSFATMNADRLTGDALQALMRHKSYSTTQRYIAMARQLDAAVEALHVPEILRQAGT